MIKTILRFIDILRRGGLRVAVSEGEDALAAAAYCGVDDVDDLYVALKATLLKDEAQKDVFDLAWRLCFRRQLTLEVPPLTCSGRDGAAVAGMNDAARRFYGLLKAGDGGAVAEAVEDALAAVDLAAVTAAELARQLKISLGWFMAAYALERDGDSDGQGLLAAADDYLRHRCEAAIIAARGEDGLDEVLSDADIATGDFAALSEERVKEMERRLQRLGKKLAGRYSYRLRPAKSGVVDGRFLLAETAKRRHLPADLRYLDKHRRRADLVVLCDISGSMGVYSSFCLQLVYAMARRFRSLRVFFFIDSVVETTIALDRPDVAAAIAAAMEAAYPKRTGRTRRQCTTTGVSDYGKALETFGRVYGDALTAGSTLLIIGDAKTNWFPPRPEELKTLSQKAKKTLWLNPEPAANWGKNDSAALLYAPYCHLFAECRTLTQLEKIATTL